MSESIYTDEERAYRTPLAAALRDAGYKPKVTAPFCYWCDPANHLEPWMVALSDTPGGPNVCRCQPGVGCGRPECPATEDIRDRWHP